MKGVNCSSKYKTKSFNREVLLKHPSEISTPGQSTYQDIRGRDSIPLSNPFCCMKGTTLSTVSVGKLKAISLISDFVFLAARYALQYYLKNNFVIFTIKSQNLQHGDTRSFNA